MEKAENIIQFQIFLYRVLNIKTTTKTSYFLTDYATQQVDESLFEHIYIAKLPFTSAAFGYALTLPRCKSKFTLKISQRQNIQLY